MIPEDAPQDVWQLARNWPLAFDFNLGLNARVVIAGAYKGLGMELIRSLYPSCHIFGFEPQEWAQQEAAERMRKMNHNNHLGWWAIEPYGLGVENGKFPIGEWHTDAASFIRTGEGTRLQGEGYLVEFGKAMQQQLIEHIDLFVLNTEGYEWKLLPYLKEKGWMNKIDRLAVQFHLDMGHDGDTPKIMSFMNETHYLRKDEFPAWMYWERK